MVNVRKGLILLGLILLMLTVAAVSNAAPTTQPLTLTGIFSIVWGDSAPDSNTEPTMDYWLTDTQGNMTKILLDEELAHPHGGVLALDGQRVTFSGEMIQSAAGDLPQLRAQSLLQREAVNRPDPFDAEPWISVACKFSDVAAEPKTIAYIGDMYRFEYPGLGDYFDRQGGDYMSIGGSTAVGWVTLPHPKAYYTDSNGEFKYLEAGDDCFQTAEPLIIDIIGEVPTQDWGFQYLFNDYIGSSSFAAANKYLHVNQGSGFGRTTWLLPWAYSNLAAVQHAMGHAYGLPHSSGSYGKDDDNQWDIMSDVWANCDRATDPVYGCVGQYFIAESKPYAWDGKDPTVVASNSSITQQLKTISEYPSYQYGEIKIPINGSATEYYTVEARRQLDYDSKMPNEGVIIYRVDSTRAVPAHVIDIDNNGNTGDDGAIWKPGEVFTDSVDQIYLCVLSETADGYNVTAAQGVVPACAVPTPTNTRTATRTYTPSRTPTPSYTPDGNWIYCAGENKTCNLPDARLARFGAQGMYIYKTLSTNFVCNAATFGGDPLPGVPKFCHYSSDPNEPMPTATPTRTPTPSATATFTRTATPTEPLTCTTKPAHPLLTKPKDGAHIPQGQAMLKWQAAACAETYIVIVTDKLTNQRVERKTGLTMLQYKTKHLQPQHDYLWQVVAVNEHGRTRSVVRTLTTK